MKLVHVIPLERTLGKEELSYFSSANIDVGSVVSIPLRNKISYGVVSGSEDVVSQKTSIKSSAFGLKKISKVLLPSFYSHEFIKAAAETADYFACSVGAVISSTLPNELIRKLSRMFFKRSVINKARTYHQKSILQNEDAERYARYKSLIRESFSRKESVMLVVSTIHEAGILKKVVEKGIESYVFLLHSDIKNKEATEILKKMTLPSHPVVLVVTPGYLSVLRNDVATIIVERESSPVYKMQKRPNLDMRFFIAKLAESAGIRLVLGDMMLRTETIASYKNGDYAEILPPKWRSQSRSKQQIVDMKTYRADLRGDFKILSKELLELVEEVKSKNENLFIFVARKGLAPTTVCGDCGSILLCPRCGSPVVLHKSDDNKRLYLCHRCGNRHDATLRCFTCNSWKLVMLGIGVERVQDELRRKFPNLKQFRLDSDSVENRSDADKIIDNFFDSPGSVLVGTELAVLYLDRSVNCVAVASIDSLFSVPDFKINERIMNILIKMRTLTTDKFLIQTRQSDMPLINFAVSGDLSGFYQSEIALRKQFDYPPYSVFVKISLPTSPLAAQEMLELKKNIGKDYPFFIFPAFSSGRGIKKPVLNGLIKISKDQWPNKNILTLLRTLSPKYQIDVDPGSIL